MRARVGYGRSDGIETVAPRGVMGLEPIHLLRIVILWTIIWLIVILWIMNYDSAMRDK